jgi:hypothetical protein
MNQQREQPLRGIGALLDQNGADSAESPVATPGLRS